MGTHLLMHPTSIDGSTLLGVDERGRNVRVTLDVSHYSGSNQAPDVMRLVNPTRTGAAALRPDNSPQLAQSQPGVASAIIFDRVEERGTDDNGVIDVKAGWGTVVCP
ncbi:MAG: hypothetical protein D6712_20385, partial [Chloroflexi bacterium]